VSKSALVDTVREATGCNVKQANDAVGEVLETIAKALKKEGQFALVGFGTFKVTKRAKRQGRNPATGEAITIAASKSVRFKPSTTLKGRL
jgi:DNA-binding protein HU-beta